MAGYLRIQAVPARRHGMADGNLSLARLSPDTAEGVLFVDVEPAGESWGTRLIEGLRHAPEETCLRVDHVLVRCDAIPDPGALTAAAGYIAERWNREPLVGAISLTPGDTSPKVLWANGDTTIDPAMLAACRNAELNALLRWGKALWTPSGYHYQLPSSEHRTTFVRLADAIRQPRDADVLAWWLLPLFARPNRALIVDSSSLLPLVLALRKRLDDAGIGLGNVGVRDAYPESPIEYRNLIDHVGGEGLVAVLSVSSTGDSAKLLAGAMEHSRSGEWRLETLVARTQDAADTWDPAVEQTGAGEPWVHLPEGRGDPHPDEPYLIIDPQTFANTVIPEPAILSILDPPHPDRDLANLLTMYDEVDGIGIECEHHKSTMARRGHNRGAVRFYPTRLLQATDFLSHARAQMTSVTASLEDGRPNQTMIDISGTHAVVCLDEDLEHPGFRELADLAVEVFAADRADCPIVPVPRGAPPGGELGEQLTAALEGRTKVLILGLGMVTGSSLQEIELHLLGACSDRPPNQLDVSALVVHARPANFEEWKSARSSFHSRLAALWITYLPWHSPLREEIETLNQVDLSPGNEEFIDGRYDVITHSIGDWAGRCEDAESDPDLMNPRSVFWHADLTAETKDLPRLLYGSRFGHRASMISTYVGVGATMERTRLERRKRGGPPWVKFDLTKSGATYFETLITVSILRWLRLYEGSWEADPKTVESVILDHWHRAEREGPQNRSMLLAEFLLAAAQGKVPRSAFTVLFELVGELAKEIEVPACVQAGLAVARGAGLEPPEEPEPET